MDTSDKTINFCRMISEIEQEKILLPDFQRKFRWTDKETQAKLVASVLCKMPIGSILLLELPAKEYAARRIGSNSADSVILLESEEKRQFLLDGQQRVTVMVNAFSDLIHENGTTKIDSLKRRFFLGLPKPENREQYGRNDWGIKDLRFPLPCPRDAVPEYMTEDIAEQIVIREFKKGEDSPFNPYGERKEELVISYCIGQKNFYLIPLYLLAVREDQRVCPKNRRLLWSVLKSIAEGQGMYLQRHYDTADGRAAWLKQWYREEELPGLVCDEGFAREIASQQENWVRDMEDYLYSCLSCLNLHIMGVPNANRAKAIEVFENLNRGGIKLSTFDLVIARAARDNRNFAEALEKECSRAGEYPDYCVAESIRPIFRQYRQEKEREKGFYNALYDMECINENNRELAKAFQDAFLNVLSLRCHEKKNPNMSDRSCRDEMSRAAFCVLLHRRLTRIIRHAVRRWIEPPFS